MKRFQSDTSRLITFFTYLNQGRKAQERQLGTIEGTNYRLTFEKTRNKKTKKFKRLTCSNSDTSKASIRRTQFNAKTVVNLSNRNLSSAERSVLVLGLNFATAPSTIPKKEIVERVEPSLTGLDKTLADSIRMQISQLFRQNIRPKFNITKDERNAMKSLRADPTIHILPAD
ncbi:uncharacterized protein LOC117100480 [Anneissia japonica]|uniref:uncharacterized protein LOC117100480 n=1 Tax=Anneissia japonica TaxID=1529436 RepID=UPI001425B589|nr:uncharacterized protein LOC117100480 [Anneissia japonica]